jgi:hypothetical protein
MEKGNYVRSAEEAAGARRSRGRRGKGKAIVLVALAVAFAIAIYFFSLGVGSDGKPEPAVESARAEAIIPDIEDDVSEENRSEHLMTATAVMPNEGKVVYYEGQ